MEEILGATFCLVLPPAEVKLVLGVSPEVAIDRRKALGFQTLAPVSDPLGGKQLEESGLCSQTDMGVLASGHLEPLLGVPAQSDIVRGQQK